MKTFIQTLGLVAVLAFALVPGQVARAQDNSDVSFQTFYDQLSNQGTWIQTDQYGYVFQPTVNDPNWRPYTYGHWVSTDNGMMWASNEPFGWATYHYGRWVNLNGYGWVWVPGYTWAPAWVSWRDSDDYYGWAPLPPDTSVGIDFFGADIGFGFGFHIGDDCDVAYGIGPGCYNFCPVAYIGDPYSWRHYANRSDNFAIINRTRNITNINVSNDPRAGRFGRVREGGPSLAQMNARSRTPISHVQLASASTLASNGRVHGNSLSVYAPNVNPATMKTARPNSVSRTLTATSVNRGTNINQPLAVNSRVSPTAATPEQVHAATVAQGNASTGAKIDRGNQTPSRALNQPLTSFRTNTAEGASSTGEPAVSHAAAAAPSTESRYTGEPVTHHTATPSTAESSFTGEPARHHTVTPTTAQSSFTGEPVTHHTAAPSVSASSFTGEPATHHVSHTSSASSFFHPSNPGGSEQHVSAPVHHTSAPSFHQSAPSFHPQSSFHPAASAPHVDGGGGGGGGHSGGGHPGGGGNQQHH